MQVNPQEVSAEKATTPAADLRLVSVEQLQKIHRELDACQKVIWLAGCGQRGYGFDPSYVTGAQEQLKAIEGLIEEQQKSSEAIEPCRECIEGQQMIDPYDGGTFITCKRCSGRGFVAVCPTCHQGVPAESAHLLYGATETIQWTREKPSQTGAYWVRGNSLEEPALIQVKRDCGELWCNLHMSTTESDFGHGYSIGQLSDKFEWLGPLHSLGSQAVQMPEWIACADRTPASEESQYLVLLEDGTRCISDYLCDLEAGWFFQKGEATHWLPLPFSPAKVDSDEGGAA